MIRLYHAGIAAYANCSRLRASRPQASLDTGAIEYSARNFLYRAFRGVDDRNAVPFEQGLRCTHLECDLARRGVSTVGAPLVADLLQTVRLDRQPEQLARILLDSSGQLSRFQIVFGQRVIGREDSILHSQIKADRKSVV